MTILPLKFIREEDKKLIGTNLYHLAKLGHLGLPVVESVIAIPPASLFENSVNRYLKNHPNVRDHLIFVKSVVLQIPIPESLRNLKILNDFPEKSKSFINIDKLWENLLEKWSYELTSKIERGEKNIYHLTPQLIVFSANFSAFGKAYYDEDREHAVIKTEQGQINFQASSAIENLIIVGNKKLLLPQVYYWTIEEGKIKILKVLPYTQSSEAEKDESISRVVPIQRESVKKVVKTATKIFLDYNSGVLSSFNFDGAVLHIKKIDIESINDQLSQILELETKAKVIFYPENNLSYDQVLEYARSFLFFRNKKNLDSQIVLPEVFSVDDFLELKRELASLGIYSKGSLKIWKQFCYPADFLNLSDYLDAGFDGAVINLDKIVKIVTGVDAETVLKDSKMDWLVALEKFFKNFGLSQIIKSGKLVLIKGKLAQNEELLSYFIKAGVWGIAFENNHSANLREHISFLEKQAIKKLNRIEIQH